MLQKQRCSKMCKSGAAWAGSPLLLSLQINIFTSAWLGLFWSISFRQNFAYVEKHIWNSDPSRSKSHNAIKDGLKKKTLFVRFTRIDRGMHPYIFVIFVPLNNKALPVVSLSRCVGFTTSEGRQNLLEEHRNRKAARENFGLPDIFQHLLRSSL